MTRPSLPPRGDEAYTIILRAEGAGPPIRCSLGLGGRAFWRLDGLKLLPATGQPAHRGLASSRSVNPLAAHCCSNFSIFSSSRALIGKAAPLLSPQFFAIFRPLWPKHTLSPFAAITTIGRQSSSGPKDSRNKKGCYESDEAVFRLRSAGAAFCLGFAFSMLCLSACIRSMICARAGASGAVTVIS